MVGSVILGTAPLLYVATANFAGVGLYWPRDGGDWMVDVNWLSLLLIVPMLATATYLRWSRRRGSVPVADVLVDGSPAPVA